MRTTEIFHQRATGNFCVPVVTGTPHCGVDDSLCRMDYRLTIAWRGRPLDENGFLLDNTWFRDFFNALADSPCTISCELLARRLATEILSAANGRAHSVTLELSAVPGVWIEVEEIEERHHGKQERAA